MDAVKYLKEEARMTKMCGISCNVCLFYTSNTKEELDCLQYKAKYPEKAVEIVEKWAAEHPVKTRQSEFLKIFPNVKTDGKGVIYISPCSLDATLPKQRDCPNSCDECRKEYWNEEVE